MPGASLRNAIPQRPYRERAQPKSREKLGILEKHKDYSARARDYNLKKARLRTLRQKATDRNPDEFHFGMMSSHTKNGVKIADRQSKSLSHDSVCLMKTQDAGYLRTVRERIRRQRLRLEDLVYIVRGEEGTELRNLHGNENASGQAGHTVFVNDEENQRGFDAEEWFGTDKEGLRVTFNRPRHIATTVVDQDARLEDTKPLHHISPREREAEQKARKAEQRSLKKARHDQQFRLARLGALKTQERALLDAEIALDHQRSQMSNSIGGLNKEGVKFKLRERKR